MFPSWLSCRWDVSMLYIVALGHYSHQCCSCHWPMLCCYPFEVRCSSFSGSSDAFCWCGCHRSYSCVSWRLRICLCFCSGWTFQEVGHRCRRNCRRWSVPVCIHPATRFVCPNDFDGKVITWRRCILIIRWAEIITESTFLILILISNIVVLEVALLFALLASGLVRCVRVRVFTLVAPRVLFVAVFITFFMRQERRRQLPRFGWLG